MRVAVEVPLKNIEYLPSRCQNAARVVKLPKPTRKSEPGLSPKARSTQIAFFLHAVLVTFFFVRIDFLAEVRIVRVRVGIGHVVEEVATFCIVQRDLVLTSIVRQPIMHCPFRHPAIPRDCVADKCLG